MSGTSDKRDTDNFGHTQARSKLVKERLEQRFKKNTSIHASLRKRTIDSYAIKAIEQFLKHNHLPHFNMAAHPRGNQSFSSSSSSRNTSRMTSGSPPPLPLFSDAISSGSSSLRSKNSTASGSHRSSRQRSSPSLGCASKRTDANMIALAKKAQLENDAMVYLDGPHVYTCGQCRTHLTSHDDIISKSFHGRKGK